ncbi:hypothetical protein [Rhodococcus sp. DMU1]|uniref:hypothetical protein n=1 Tax=Rhodococcus sp. DMU1 TaxID=2722825 RepID=UPI001FF0C2EF|nr:hypothetical protein [Rhodococcus sp. DMU1]
MMAMHCEQFALPVAVGRVQPSHPPDDQAAGHMLALAAGGEDRDLGFCELGIGDPPPLVLVVDGVRVLDRRPRRLVDRGDRRLDLWVHSRGHRKPGSGALRRRDERVPEVGRIGSGEDLPADSGAAGGRDGLREQSTGAGVGGYVPAPQPARAITGAATGADTTASCAFKPRTREYPNAAA